jgi:hypothetical protein
MADSTTDLELWCDRWITAHLAEKNNDLVKHIYKKSIILKNGKHKNGKHKNSKHS